MNVAKSFMTNAKRFTHICVSEALKKDLYQKIGIKAIVLYDRPGDEFHPTDVSSAHKLFQKFIYFVFNGFLIRLATEFEVFSDSEGSLRRTVFTEITTTTGLQARWREKRPYLLVSSCSWTPDDDITLFINALEIYNRQSVVGKDPKIICLITGQGPCKAKFKRKIENMVWTNVKIILPWLEIADYPKLLGCADLGICLHRSTSNLDLPMKVVDLFGCGVPVLALNYPAINELIQDKITGCIFDAGDNGEELARHLFRLVSSAGQQELNNYRQNVVKLRNQPQWRWQNEWKSKMLPLISTCVSDGNENNHLD